MMPASHSRTRPVCIPAHSFGDQKPYKDLYVSQQHRVLIDSSKCELLFGASQMLVASKSLIGSRGHLDQQATSVEYFHILCARHVILLANGLPCESLLLAGESLRNLPDEHVSQIHALMGHNSDQPPILKVAAAAPLLRHRESQVLIGAMGIA